MHEVPLSVGLARLAKFFPVWPITSIITLFFSRVASPLDHRCWLISRTGSQYEAVVSVEVFAVVGGMRDIRHVARRRARPPGDQIRGTAQIDCQHEPHTLGVDIQPRKRRLGKVSRTVSSSPLVLDMTVMCTSGVMAPPPGISTRDVLALATVVSTMDAVSTSTPFVVPPAPVVERPGKQAQEFATCRLSKSLEFLPLFRLSSSSPALTLPRGSAKDSSPPFSLDRVQVGHSQEVPGEDSSFSVSPLSPGIFFQPPPGSTSPPAGGALLPTTADDCVASGLGDPITAAWCEQYPGSESPWSLPGCVAVRFLLSAGPSGASDWVGFEDLCSTAGGILDLCTSRGLGGGRVITDWTAKSSVQILGVQRSAVYRWKPSIWIAASSPSVFWTPRDVRSRFGSSLVMDCDCCSGGNSSPGGIV